MAGKSGRRGFGSVRQERSGRWSARVPIPNSGGQHRSLGTFRTKRDAEAALSVEEAAIVGGRYVDPSQGQVTLADFGARFVATNGYRPRAKALQQRLLDIWVAPRHYVAIGRQQHPVELGTRTLASITADDVRLWHTAVTEESRRRAIARHERAIAAPKRVNAAIRAWAAEQGHTVAATGRIPAPIRAAWEAGGGAAALEAPAKPTAGLTEPAQAYRLLHAILERAVSDGRLPRNPARIKKGGEVAYPEVEPATMAEVRVIADAMPRRYRAAVWLAALTSLRSGELFALRRKDYNPQTRKLRVERAVELATASDDFGRVKADASLRTVTVPALGAEVLEEHLAEFVARSPNALIFTTSTGGLVYPDRIGKPFDRARSEAGRPDLTWHDLRHTGQSLAARAGAGVKELQARAGHVTMTAAARYLHRYADADRRVAESLDALAREEIVALDAT